MKENYYILQDGILKRKENTVYFVNKEIKRVLPINKISAIFSYGRISFSSGVVSYLAKNGVLIHFFNKYGFYEASLYPRETLVSGHLLIKQAEAYLDNGKRIEIAREFIDGMSSNIIKNLQYYKRSGESVETEIETIERLANDIIRAKSIKEILGIEGNIWDTYYKAFEKILPKKFEFKERSRQPPKNMLNCLISFGNSLLYSVVLSEIYNTQLNPTISYLHEPFERRFSLSLDISEVFKPLLVDRTIFRLINKREMDERDFERDLEYCLLNKSGKRKFLQRWEERLKTTIKHRSLGRNVSYQRLIRLECYKLIKHLLGEKKYKAFKIWW